MRIDRTAQDLDASINPATGRRLVPRTYLYDSVIDLMLADPGITLSAIAAQLGRSPSWMTYIVHTDAFRDQYNARRKEKNEKISAGLTEALQRVAMKGMDILEKQLTDNPKSVSPMMALEIADKSLERLGYGVKLPGAAVQINNNAVLQISEADFAHARTLVRQVENENLASAQTQARTITLAKVREPSLRAVLDEEDEENDEDGALRALGE